MFEVLFSTEFMMIEIRSIVFGLETRREKEPKAKQKRETKYNEREREGGDRKEDEKHGSGCEQKMKAEGDKETDRQTNRPLLGSAAMQ
jgi:hypothetical protein